MKLYQRMATVLAVTLMSAGCPGDQHIGSGDAEVTPDGTVELCHDGLDNDGDGKVDCEDSDCATAPACGGFCSPVTFLAPLPNAVLTEVNDDLDPNAACVQYDVVIDVTDPDPDSVPATLVCLYIDNINSAAVACADPALQNPITFRVTLCEGQHTLYARVEQGTEVCDQLNFGLALITVDVYENVSCAIVSPSALSTDPANPTCWTAELMDVDVATTGTSVDLSVGASIYSATVFGGLASFPSTPLGLDGSFIMRATCFSPGNPLGLLSPDYYITKDTVEPNVQILSPPTGSQLDAANCPITVVVTGVEAGQPVCAHFTGQTPPPSACSSTSTGPSDQLTLTVPCINGTNLTVEANTQDECANPGQDTILVSVNTQPCTLLIESPVDGQIYNKADDVIDPVTDALEMNLVACVNQSVNPATITLSINGQQSPLTASVQAAACMGMSHRITWSALAAFTPSVSGLQTPYHVEVTVICFAPSVAVADFAIDTVPPVLELGCVGCEPAQASYVPADDVCPLTPEYEVLTRMRVSGLEAGQPVTLSVTNDGTPVGLSPYQEPSLTPGPHWIDFNMPCGVQLYMGDNLLTATATDQAGNPAIPVQQTVTLAP